MRCCKDTALCCPRLQSLALSWCKRGSLGGKCGSLCLVMANECGTPAHSNLCSQPTLFFFYPVYLQPFLCHICEYGVCCRTDEIMSFWIWMKLDIEEWVSCSDLMQSQSYHFYQNIEVEMWTQVSLTVLARETDRNLPEWYWLWADGNKLETFRVCIWLFWDVSYHLRNQLECNSWFVVWRDRVPLVTSLGM